ncbi:hypothetical protein EB20_01354 [Enterococcus hirae]|nr:hypothetical protein EB20_01354 [Enterococcus hirae]RBT51407.1 hypothetical protein EB24_02945 [Enterococcus hirae]RBT55994.1 hypothetical protein EB10_00002 [Enterococcus hirae]
MILFWKRNKDISLIPIFMFLIYIFFPVNLKNMDLVQLELLNNMMDSLLSFSSLATTFLFFAVTFIPVIGNNSSLFINLKTDQKFLEKILFLSFIFLIISVLCLIFIVGRFIDFNLIRCKLFFTILFAMLAYSILGMLGIFFELILDPTKKINSKK